MHNPFFERCDRRWSRLDRYISFSVVEEFGDKWHVGGDWREGDRMYSVRLSESYKTEQAAADALGRLMTLCNEMATVAYGDWSTEPVMVLPAAARQLSRRSGTC